MARKLQDAANGYGPISTLSIPMCKAFDMDQERYLNTSENLAMAESLVCQNWFAVVADTFIDEWMAL
jgi:hypothetical protein